MLDRNDRLPFGAGSQGDGDDQGGGRGAGRSQQSNMGAESWCRAGLRGARDAFTKTWGPVVPRAGPRAVCHPHTKSGSVSWGRYAHLVRRMQTWRLTLCDSTDWSLPVSSVRWTFLGNNTRVGHHFLLQGIFPTQESSPCLLCPLHWRWIVYLLSHQESHLIRVHSRNW